MARDAMRIKVDRNLCIGAGRCMASAPAIFDQSQDDGLVLLLLPMVDALHWEQVLAAVNGCPSGAISIEGCGTGPAELA